MFEDSQRLKFEMINKIKVKVKGERRRSLRA